jgi:hypothetical protein
MPVLVTDSYEFHYHLNQLRNPANEMNVVGIRTEVQASPDIHVGYLLQAKRCKLPRIFCADDEIIFSRYVPKALDVFSFVEETYSLSMNVWWLLHDIGVRLTVTTFGDTRDTVIAAVDDFDTESDLGIGFLRRCAKSKVAYLGPITVPLQKEQHVFDLWAEKRESILQNVAKASAQSYDPRQDPLF